MIRTRSFVSIPAAPELVKTDFTVAMDGVAATGKVRNPFIIRFYGNIPSALIEYNFVYRYMLVY